MRKWICVLLMAALIAMPISALAKELDKKLFANAKEAVNLISYGEYKKALKKLGLSTEKESVQKLEALAEDSLSSAFYGDVQTDVAVSYKTGKGYKLAVPIESPDMGNVEALVLLSKDGQSFNNYSAMLWNDVLDEVSGSDSVTWNEAYEKNRPVIVADE